MITTLDPAAATGVGAQAQNKIAETYQTPRVREVPRDGVAPEGAETAALPAERAGEKVAGVRGDTASLGKTPSGRDQAAINFQMTREEREVFLSAMSGRERVSEMSDREQELMEKASERLEKIIEAADTRDAASRERVDKAVKEWYLRLSNGKQPPADLITLIRQSAAGLLD